MSETVASCDQKRDTDTNLERILDQIAEVVGCKKEEVPPLGLQIQNFDTVLEVCGDVEVVEFSVVVRDESLTVRVTPNDVQVR